MDFGLIILYALAYLGLNSTEANINEYLLITKKINNSIDFLRHADETRFSNFLWDILGKLGHFWGRMIPETKLIPKVD